MNKKILTFILTCAVIFSLASGVFAADFTDVPANHRHKDAIDFCAQNEFMMGYGEGIFKPDGDITRGEFITVWARTFHARRHNFNDATKTKDEVDNAIVLMSGLGFVNGVSPTRFSVNEKITREEVAKIVENTYLRGIDGDDQYENYADSDEISAWAKNAVSVCYKEGIFEGVASAKFEPQEPITRSEVCSVITKLLKKEAVTYNITVGDITDGNITPNKSKAEAGETVTLVIAPDQGRRLKEGTLKYNNIAINGTSFIMPSQDVTIAAEFEPYLESIQITTPASQSEYEAGATLNLNGLVITAYYTDETTKVVTNYTTTPDEGDVLQEAEGEGNSVDVIVSYTEGSITKTTKFEIIILPPRP